MANELVRNISERPPRVSRIPLDGSRKEEARGSYQGDAMAEARMMGKSELFSHFAERFEKKRTQVTDKEFEDHIAERLRGAGLKFQRDPGIRGLQPDFLVTGPRGQRVVIEAKAWDPRGGNTARALEQVARYQSVTGVDKSFLVLPALRKNFEVKGVVSANALEGSLKAFFAQPRRGHKRGKPSGSSRRRAVFGAMPFGREYDDTYFVAMSYAAERVQAICTRVDQTEFTGDIVEEIKRLIKASVAVIVDLSEAKPNVLYEAGYSHALNKPTVHICSTPLSELPFDVRNWNTLQYSRGRTTGLRDPLARRLKTLVD